MGRIRFSYIGSGHFALKIIGGKNIIEMCCLIYLSKPESISCLRTEVRVMGDLVNECGNVCILLLLST